VIQICLQKNASELNLLLFQTRIQQDASSHIKKRYYHHSMTDPFLALHRDNELSKEKSSQKDEEVSEVVK